MAYQTNDVNGIFITKLTANDSTPKETLGRIRELDDGRRFRYTRMTGSALALAEIVMPATKVAVTNAYSESVVGPDGATTTAIVDADAAWTPDAYVGWYYQTATGMTGSTEPIKIVGNSATRLILEKTITTALTTSAVATDDGEIVAGHAAAILSTANDLDVATVGVGIGTITTNYYGWVQVASIGAVIGDSIAEGESVAPGGNAAGQAIAADSDADCTIIGKCIATSGTNEYCMVDLNIA